MAYKQKKGKKYIAAYVDQKRWQSFRLVASLCSISVADSVDEALELFIQAKLPVLAESIKSGTGVWGQFKNDLKIIKETLS